MTNTNNFHVTNIFSEIIASFFTSEERNEAMTEMVANGCQVGWCDTDSEGNRIA